MDDIPQNWIRPNWPDLPANVYALVSTRDGGVSEGCWASFNPAAHVHDLPQAVATNRQQLQTMLQTLDPKVEPLVFVEQVHGVDVLPAGFFGKADAVYSAQSGKVCAVMTADCLPVFFANAEGTEVAVAHAGWRGLAAGVLERTLSQFQSQHLSAWLGPAIGPTSFEVGEDVRQAFLRAANQLAEPRFQLSANSTLKLESGDQQVSEFQQATDAAFVPVQPGYYLCDIYQLARLRLSACGIENVYGGGFCTVKDERFFSYRRDGVCGRMISLIGFNDSGQ